MEDVLEVYEKPLSADKPVVCVDEKPVALHNDVRDPIPMKPGSVAKQDSEYVHNTPIHGSWLNQAELEIGLFAKQCLGKRRLGDIRILRAEAQAWNRRINRKRTTIDWTFDRKKARKKFKYKYKTKRS